MARAVGLAAAVAGGMGALIIAAWLIFRTNAQMAVGTQGAVELAATAIVLALLAIAQMRIAGLPGYAGAPAEPPQR
jgi:hypothetical protein